MYASDYSSCRLISLLLNKVIIIIIIVIIIIIIIELFLSTPLSSATTAGLRVKVELNEDTV